jgi:hypothetical protein
MELELHSVKNVMPDVDMVLKVSLEDLPYDLKNCFLHCALFPEDYSIKRRRIKENNEAMDCCWIGQRKGEQNIRGSGRGIPE